MRPAGRPARGAESPGIPGYIDLQGAPQRGSNRCVARCPINVPRHAQTPLDEATQMRHAKRPDHYLCDAAEQQFTHLSSLGVKWSQVQILSARHRSKALSRSEKVPFSCSYPNGIPKAAHKPSTVPRPSIAARAVSSEVWPYGSPVTLIDEWPRRSAAALMWAPDSSQATASESRLVWAPTLCRPDFFAASSTARSTLRGSASYPQLRAEHHPGVRPLIAGEGFAPCGSVQPVDE